MSFLIGFNTHVAGGASLSCTLRVLAPVLTRSILALLPCDNIS